MNKFIPFIVVLFVSFLAVASNDLKQSNCKKIIYDAMLENINNITPTQDYFDRVDALAAQMKTALHFARIQKIGEQIYYDFYDEDAIWRLQLILDFINKHKSKFDDFDMVINLFDENNSLRSLSYNKIFYSGPIFTTGYSEKDLSMYDGQNMFILYPDFHTVSENYKINVEKLQTIKEQKFEDKIDKAVFRGGNHSDGGIAPLVPEFIRHHPRGKIFLLSYLFENYLDAKPTNLGSWDLELEGAKRLRALYESLFGKNLQNNYLSMEEQSKYKYIISLDGIVSSWSRPQLITFSGSLLLYQTDYHQWF